MTTVLLCRNSLSWTSTPSATRLSTASLARAKADEQLVQLRERLGHPGRRSRCDRRVERVLRGIAIVHDDSRPPARFLECHGRDLATLIAFVVGPGQARRRGHLEVTAE